MRLSKYSLAVACIVIAMNSAAAQDVESETHDYFDHAVAHEAPAATDVHVYVDDRLLPARVRLSCRQPMNPMDEAEPIDFVLVLPGTVDVDGLTFVVERPFYIATTELSNGQHAQLHHEFTRFEDYESWAFDRYAMARLLDMEIPGDELDAIQQHLADPSNPSIRMDLGAAAMCAHTLSRSTETYVRLPSMAEWFLAMRAGAPTRYWWGDEVRGDLMAWRGNDPEAGDSFSFVRPVTEGPANPLGLVNVLGNAAEMVFPTREERALLRTRFGATATEAREPKHRKPGFQITSLSVFGLGGSVEAGRFHSSAEVDGFVHDTSDLSTIVLWHQFVTTSTWINSTRRFVGTRLVLEAPPGIVRIERPEPDTP